MEPHTPHLLRLYRYRLRKMPINGWYRDADGNWHKDGLATYFSHCIFAELPGQTDICDASLPMFRALLDHGVDLDDIYEYQGEPATFVWPPGSSAETLTDQMHDVVKLRARSPKE